MLVIFIITILISTWVLLKTKETIQVLINSIFIFVIISGLLAMSGHSFVAGIFIIVYAGAILVMICVGFLVSPPVRKKKLKDKIKNSITEQVEVFPASVIYIYSILLTLLIAGIYFSYKYNGEVFETEKHNLKMSLYQTYIDNIKLYIDMNCGLEAGQHLDTGIAIINKIKFFDVNLNILKNMFINSKADNLTLYYTNKLSQMYSERAISFVALGLYLYFILLVCLRVFMIISKLTKIKRQDIIDQILKIWRKED